MRKLSGCLLVAAAAVLGAAIAIGSNRALTEVALGLIAASVLVGMRGRPQ